MKEINLVHTVFKINMLGKSYEVRKPTVDESNKFAQVLEENEKSDNKKSELELNYDFLEGLGLPREASAKLENEHLEEISRALSGKKKAK